MRVSVQEKSVMNYPFTFYIYKGVTQSGKSGGQKAAGTGTGKFLANLPGQNTTKAKIFGRQKSGSGTVYLPDFPLWCD